MSKRHYPTPDDLLAKQASLRPPRLERIRHVARNRQRGLMVIMEDVHNPHNLGAIARSCDAFGVQQVAFSMQNAEHFDPQQETLIASRAASKWLDYRIFHAGTEHALTTLQHEGWHIVATLANADAVPLWDFDAARHERLAILVGNEHAGLSPTAARLSDAHLTIPMLGMAQSFNVSVATALVLAEVTRQRRASGQDFSLSADEVEALTNDLIMRA